MSLILSPAATSEEEETKILRAKGKEAAEDPAFLNGTVDPAGTDPFISGPSIPAVTDSQPGAASDSAGADPAGGESGPDRQITINTAASSNTVNRTAGSKPSRIS